MNTKRALAALVCVAGLLLVGCASPLPEEWAARVAAADAVWFPADRDQAYRAVALDAADANQPDVVKTCVKRTWFPFDRDQTASEASMRLLDAGNRQAAVDVAKLMWFPHDRDRTLLQLARTP